MTFLKESQQRSNSRSSVGVLSLIWDLVNLYGSLQPTRKVSGDPGRYRNILDVEEQSSIHVLKRIENVYINNSYLHKAQGDM